MRLRGYDLIPVLDSYRKEIERIELRLLEQITNKIQTDGIDSVSDWHIRKLQEYRELNQLVNYNKENYEGLNQELVNRLKAVENRERQRATHDYTRAMGYLQPKGNVPKKAALGESDIGLFRHSATIAKIQLPSWTRIERAVEDQFTDTINDIVTKVRSGTDSLQSAVREAETELGNKGIVLFTDRAGRQWGMSSYLSMAAHTQAHNTATEAYIDRVQTMGGKYVIVSDHVGECALCRPFEAQIFAVDSTGVTDEYPHLDVAIMGGLFHPGCEHRIIAYDPEIARVYKPDWGASEEERTELSRIHTDRKEAASKAKKYARIAAATTDPGKKKKYRALARKWRKHENDALKAENAFIKRLKDRNAGRRPIQSGPAVSRPPSDLKPPVEPEVSSQLSETQSKEQLVSTSTSEINKLVDYSILEGKSEATIKNNIYLSTLRDMKNGVPYESLHPDLQAIVIPHQKVLGASIDELPHKTPLERAKWLKETYRGTRHLTTETVVIEEANRVFGKNPNNILLDYIDAMENRLELSQTQLKALETSINGLYRIALVDPHTPKHTPMLYRRDGKTYYQAAGVYSFGDNRLMIQAPVLKDPEAVKPQGSQYNDWDAPQRSFVHGGFSHIEQVVTHEYGHSFHHRVAMSENVREHVEKKVQKSKTQSEFTRDLRTYGYYMVEPEQRKETPLTVPQAERLETLITTLGDEAKREKAYPGTYQVSGYGSGKYGLTETMAEVYTAVILESAEVPKYFRYVDDARDLIIRENYETKKADFWGKSQFRKQRSQFENLKR